LTHWLPQEPQLSTSLFVFVSHPFTGLPSQFVQPELQTGVHVPPTQLVVPCALVHWTPHEPQLFVEVDVCVSQPFVALPSQLPNPPLQSGVQVPPVQLVLPFGLRHWFPQALQLLTLLFRLVSHPLTGLPSQLAKPAAHTGAQVPEMQLVVPFELVHCVPQEPQLLALVLTLVSHPLFGLPSQSAVPAEQLGSHTPATQAVVPFAFVHVTPHAPQLPVLVFVFVSQPLVALPSQLA
jgi:hypothetical protein